MKSQEKKKKITKTNLEFCESHPFDRTKVEIDKVNETEVAMSNTDRLVNGTTEKLSEIES